MQLYESINVQTSPELKKKLMANQMNTVTCKQCALTFWVDKPLLYHDPVRHFMIYQIPMGENAVENGERQFTESLGRLSGLMPKDIQAPDVSLVFSRTELVERIFLRDAGLNERIIEYIKYMIYIRNMGKVDPVKKILLFDVEDSTPEALCFVVQDAQSKKLETVLHYNRKTYTALCETFDKDDQTPTLLELFPGPYISARRLLLKEKSKSASKEPESDHRNRRIRRIDRLGCRRRLPLLLGTKFFIHKQDCRIGQCAPSAIWICSNEILVYRFRFRIPPHLSQTSRLAKDR